jgi:hypothetical protein
MRRQVFFLVSAFLICFSASVASGEPEVRTYTYTASSLSTTADETPSAVTISPGQCQLLTKSFTLDAVSASQITRLRLESAMPNFLDLDLLDASKSGNTFSHEYQICVQPDAPCGSYDVEMTFIFLDALDSEVTRRNHTEVVVVPCAPLLPTAPGSLSANPVSSSQINLSWQDRSSNESGFKIERSFSLSSGFSQIAVVGENATSYSNIGLAPSTTYYYRVRAYNSSGDSGPSNTSSATTPPWDAPDDYGDSCSQATDISLNSSRNGRIDFPGDLDYFRISVPAEGQLRVFSSGSTDTWGGLHSSICTILEEDDDSGEGLNFLIQRDVTLGTYYISVRHLSSSGTGDYILNVEFYSEDLIVYPQLALGGGYEVALFLSNSTTTSWNGTVFLERGNGQGWYSAWNLNGIDRTGSSSFDVYLAPNATQKFVLTSKTGVSAGYLRITGKAGARVSDISSSFFYDVSVNGQLIDSIGIPAGVPSRQFICPVERNDEALTGFAWAPASPEAGFPIRLALYDSSGTLIRSVTVSFEGHSALFFHEVFDSFPDNFVGKVAVDSEAEIHLTVLRLCWTQSGFQLTSVPPSSK